MSTETPAPSTSSASAAAAPPPSSASAPKKISPSARKILQKLSSLNPNASLETIQTIASWIIFNRKKCEGMGEGILVAIQQALEDNKDEQKNNVAPRLMLLLKIVHQVLLSNCPTATSATAVAEGDSDKWEKSSQLRIRLGELTILPLWKALATSFTKLSSHVQEEQYQGEIKGMLEDWKEHNVFGGPTVWEEYKKGWTRALKDATSASAASAGDAMDTTVTVDSTEKKEKRGEDADTNAKKTNGNKLELSPDDAIKSATTTEGGDVPKDSSSEAKSSAPSDEKNDESNGSTNATPSKDEKQDGDALVEKIDRSFQHQESTGSTASSRRISKRDSIASVDIEVDFEGVEETKVEPTQFLNACKAIASIQITRDLGSDASMNLSSALSNIPPEVEEACNTMLTQQQQNPDETKQSITELLSDPESLSKIPDEVLDLDLQYARQSLQTYREAIRQQRKARLQCLQLLLASRCSFGSMEAARAFCGNGGASGTGDDSNNNDGGDDANIDMDEVLEKLKKRKEILVDAMALEGLDVEEDEEEKKSSKEDESLKPLGWFPGQGGEEQEPAAKKVKLSA